MYSRENCLNSAQLGSQDLLPLGSRTVRACPGPCCLCLPFRISTRTAGCFSHGPVPLRTGAPGTLDRGWRQQGTMFLGFQELVKASASVAKWCPAQPKSGSWVLHVGGAWRRSCPFCASTLWQGLVLATSGTIPLRDSSYSFRNKRFSLQTRFQQRLSTEAENTKTGREEGVFKCSGWDENTGQKAQPQTGLS